MTLRSLQSRILVLILSAVTLVAAAVMAVSFQLVGNYAETAAERAVTTILELNARDVEARYQSLLKDKLGTIQARREQVELLGRVVRAGLDGFVAEVEAGAPEEEVKRRALAWIRKLEFGGGRYAFAYDRSFRALTYPNDSLTGQFLTAYLDVKGRRVVVDMFQNAERSGRGFAAYRWPKLDGSGLASKFGAFLYFPAWDWVVVIADDVQDVEADVDQRTRQIERALTEILHALTLARDGFVFIVAGDGRVVVPPPPDKAALAQAVDRTSGRSLAALVAASPAEGPITGTTVSVGAPPKAWEMRAIGSKGLDWRIAALVPRADLARPATSLVTTQGLVFAGLLLLALGVAFVMARRMVRPLHRLTAYARLLPRQQLEEARETRSPIADLPARNRDEVGRLAEAFLMMEERLRDNVRQLMRETSARERIESELAIARELQLGLLPVIADEIGDEEPVEIHAVVRPAKEVGGDLFDVFRVRPRVLCLAVGDVSGKGVPGAFFMGVAKTLLRVAAEGAAEPGSVVARVNDALSRNNPNLMFVTLFVAFLDLDTGALTYVNAGHPPPLLLPAGEGGGRLLPGLSGPACGVMEGLPYRAFEASLATGDLLAIFTDGVTDAADAADQLFGDERTQATLQRLREASPRAVVEGLVAELDRFAEGTPQADDVTVLALRLRASEAPILTETAKEPATCAVPALS